MTRRINRKRHKLYKDLFIIAVCGAVGISWVISYSNIVINTWSN
jgi:hypothetical protein